jgi:hypothetical protein
MLAAVPSSASASNSTVIKAVAWCGVLSAVLVLIAAGVINLFT